MVWKYTLLLQTHLQLNTIYYRKESVSEPRLRVRVMYFNFRQWFKEQKCVYIKTRLILLLSYKCILYNVLCNVLTMWLFYLSCQHLEIFLYYFKLVISDKKTLNLRSSKTGFKFQATLLILWLNCFSSSIKYKFMPNYSQ